MEILMAIFLFLKTGEKFATQEMAGPTVTAFTDYVGTQAGVRFTAQVLNEPAQAVKFSEAKQPLCGIVTAGFYLTYAKALAMEPVLEVRREKVAAERYVLVAKKDDSEKLADWAGKTIATTLAAEQRYVIGVVLRGQLGDEIRLVAPGSVEDALFDLAEGAKSAANGVLVEESAWQLFAEEPVVGEQLKVIFKSEDLPRDLFVSFRGGDVAKVKAALLALSEGEEGKQVLGSIRVEKFDEVQADRLAKARELFNAK